MRPGLGRLKLCLACLALSAGGGGAILACSSKETGTTPDAGAPADASAPADGGSDAAPPPVEGGRDADVASTFPDAGTVTITRTGGTPISPFAFGHNYWDWVDWARDGITGVTGTEPQVKALHLNVIRAGGANNDMNEPSPAVFDTAQLDAFVAYCRTVGAEPMLQVPVVAVADGGPATAQTAADMVTYADVTRGYGIKYWEIGNEPDLYPTTYDAGVPLTASDFCTLYQSFATAMKAANAAAPGGGVPMTFLGPDLAYSYIPGADWLTPFLDGCKDYVDVVAIHRYPFSGMATSTTGALNDVTSFRTAINSVSAILAAHARPGTPLAITEANISCDYLASAYAPASLFAAPTTFYAGLWTADILGAALQKNLWTLAFWDIGDPTSAPSVLGFLQDGQPVPAYYTEQMISTAFRGSTVVPTGTPIGFSAYASYDANSSRQVAMYLRTMKRRTASQSPQMIRIAGPFCFQARGNGTSGPWSGPRRTIKTCRL